YMPDNKHRDCSQPIEWNNTHKPLLQKAHWIMALVGCRHHHHKAAYHEEQIDATVQHRNENILVSNIGRQMEYYHHRSGNGTQHLHRRIKTIRWLLQNIHG